MNTRPRIDQLGLSPGKKTRLYRILHEHGLRNGTAIFLPYDHGLEHARETSSATRPHLRAQRLPARARRIAPARPQLKEILAKYPS